MPGADRKEPDLSWELLSPGALTRSSVEWNQLVAEAGYPPFLQAEFLMCAVRVLGCERGRLVIGRQHGRMMAGGLLVPVGRGRWCAYQPSQLPLGAWVMQPGSDWRNTCRSLLGALPGFAGSLAVTQQDPRLVSRPSSCSDCEDLDYVETGWIDVAGSFDDYWKGRGKNLRQNLPKLKRRLEERGARLSFEFLEQPAAVDAAFAEYAALESAGWKAEGGTAISADNVQGTFYREMLQDYARRGAAFAVRLMIDGHPIAVDFGLRDAECMVILKTTYDQGYRAYSPAQLLHEQAFTHVFQHRLARRIEFFGKLMEWHTRWTDQSRMLFHVNYYRSPWLRTARDLLKRTRRGAMLRSVSTVEK
jgi:hypothetical protein